MALAWDWAEPGGVCKKLLQKMPLKNLCVATNKSGTNTFALKHM